MPKSDDRRVPWPAVTTKGELDVAELATVTASSEQPVFPIANVLDNQRGPGGSCWIASEPGEQTVLLAFRTPQVVRSVSIECEEHGSTRTQDVRLGFSRDGGKVYDELPSREFRFSPYGATFERESWSIGADGITHLRLRITPERTQKDARACLTTLILT
jgi:hypothetical protein